MIRISEKIRELRCSSARETTEALSKTWIHFCFCCCCLFVGESIKSGVKKERKVKGESDLKKENGRRMLEVLRGVGVCGAQPYGETSPGRELLKH